MTRDRKCKVERIVNPVGKFTVSIMESFSEFKALHSRVVQICRQAVFNLFNHFIFFGL